MAKSYSYRNHGRRYERRTFEVETEKAEYRPRSCNSPMHAAAEAKWKCSVQLSAQSGSQRLEAGERRTFWPCPKYCDWLARSYLDDDDGGGRAMPAYAALFVQLLSDAACTAGPLLFVSDRLLRFVDFLSGYCLLITLLWPRCQRLQHARITGCCIACLRAHCRATSKYPLESAYSLVYKYFDTPLQFHRQIRIFTIFSIF